MAYHATLRKWSCRFAEHGEVGLHSQSNVRKNLPPRKVTEQYEKLILELRQKRHLGPKGIQRELKRLHNFALATSTIWIVLRRNKVSPLHSGKRPKKPKRYNRPVPGDRVQLDTCKIGKGLYQLTAVDDCTRMRFLGLYDARTARNAVHFLVTQMLSEFPFPIQRVQTDRGCEFIGFEFQDTLREQRIKFRPNRPAAPHLNGKVERSQRTDRMEFWSTVDRSLGRDELRASLKQWQRFYNEDRRHSSLAEKPPAQRLQELQGQIPTKESVQAPYDPEKEIYQTSSKYCWQPA